MDREKFSHAIRQAELSEGNGQIGTLQEKLLHSAVKFYLESNEAYHEIKFGGYYADILKDNHIYEVQTRHFYKLRNKLACFLEQYQVTVVFPVFYHKWLIWMDPQTKEITKKRLSPKTGNIYRIFHELYQIKMLLGHPSLSFRILLIDMEEIRLKDGWSPDGKKGSHRLLQRPIFLQEETEIENLSAFRKLLPPGLPSRFTSRDFATSSLLSLKKAQLAVNVLTETGTIVKTGTIGKYHLYQTKDTYETEKENHPHA